MHAGESARAAAQEARDKADHWARRAALFERGADGEVETARVLAHAEPEWVSLHDYRWPGRQKANLDHIAIGPGGIFVIDSKNWSGAVGIEDQRLTVNGRSQEKLLEGARDAARDVANLVRGYGHHVHGAVCFVGDHDVADCLDGVRICSTANVVDMLRSREPVLDRDQVQQLAMELALALTRATEELPAAPPSFAVPPRVHLQPAASRGSHHARRLIAFATAAAVLIVLCFTVLPAVPGMVSKGLVGLLQTDTSTSTPDTLASHHADGPSAGFGSRQTSHARAAHSPRAQRR